MTGENKVIVAFLKVIKTFVAGDSEVALTSTVFFHKDVRSCLYYQLMLHNSANNPVQVRNVTINAVKRHDTLFLKAP